MKAFELIGEADEVQHLNCCASRICSPGPVRGIVLKPDNSAVDGEQDSVTDWLAASTPSLQEVWDSTEDAPYDNL